MGKSYSFIRGWLGPTLALMLAVAPVAAAEDLSEMSFEELMEQQLDQMGITGIHHTHDAGEWMVGYSFMAMGMDGNLDGTNSRGKDDIFAQGFIVAPTEMYMEMHMLNVMYGVTDELTLMLMVPYHRKSMDHVRMDGVKFTTRTRGIGDISLSGLYSLYRDETHRLIGIAGLSFPSGSIDETDTLPAPGNLQRLPYPMQLGSGTWDFKLGATYLGQVPNLTWGAHSSGLIHAGENKHDYRLGNTYEVTGWGARKINDWSSGSLRLKWSQWFNIHGADPALNPAMVPTADPNRRAGRRLDVLFGANVFAAEGRLDGLRLGLEGGVPVYQWLDGPQLETDWIMSLTVEWTF